jgi:uncharacterized membrane protein required for colicin V production
LILDLFLICILILYSLFGLRDGLVKKLVGIAAIVLALFLGQAFMRDAGDFMVQNMGMAPSSAPSMGFFGIFLGVTLVVSVVYRLASGNFKIGGMADRVLGVVLGFIQGALIASSLLLFMALQGSPSRQTARDSRLYKPLVNLAPQILDLGAELGPEAVKHIDSLTRPGPVSK